MVNKMVLHAFAVTLLRAGPLPFSDGGSTLAHLAANGDGKAANP
jgi:hypothetical protein